MPAKLTRKALPNLRESAPNKPYNCAMIKPRYLTALACAIALLPVTAGNAALSKSLSFYHTHTQNRIEVTFFENGSYRPEALTQLRGFLGDWRNGEQHDIDPTLLEILWEIQSSTKNDGVFEVISAYRSPQTNLMLRKRSKAVAKKSQHILGKAIDVRLRGLDTAELRDRALAMRRGGVGYYEQSDFVHLDTGRVRRW
jgi:uncharacterized protein YcbK (DUF882 family)